MKKIGLSTSSLQRVYGDKEAIRIAKECGADAIDFCTDVVEDWEIWRGRLDIRTKDSVYAKGDEAVIEYFTELKNYADEFGIEICQTHGRCSGFINEKEYDETFVENVRLDLLAASILGAPVCVIHAITTMNFGPECDPKIMRDINFDMFTKIMPFAKKYGVKVATETFGDSCYHGCCDFFGNIDEFIKSYNRVCAVEDYKDWHTICVDTGHSNKATRFNNNPSAGDVIRMLGGNVTVLHLNDNDTLTDQHKIPLTGTIDWDDVFDALDEIGYDGCYNMELDLKYFGENFVVETAKFAVESFRNVLKNRY